MFSYFNHRTGYRCVKMVIIREPEQDVKNRAVHKFFRIRAVVQRLADVYCREISFDLLR